MKKQFIAALLVIFGFYVFFIFGRIASNRGKSVEYNVVVNEMSSTVGEGLDLSAVLELLKESKDATSFETALNAKNGINNLDLDNDGVVDYIKVTEYGKGETKGFSLSVDLDKDESQEIATIELEKVGEKVDAQISGNEYLYGNNRHYHSSFGVTDFLLWSYLLRPHPFYVSPFYYGYYPTWYRSYPVVGYNSYRSNVGRYSTVRNSSGYSSTRKMQSKVTSPNKTKNSYVKSQKSFATRDTGKKVKSGGFGKSKPTVRKSSSSSGGYSSGK